MNMEHLISIIIPIHNGELWIDRCFQAILQQQINKELAIEVCVCNDASTDNTSQKLNEWELILQCNEVALKVYHSKCEVPKGVGYAKNKAVGISSGGYLCFQDVDDVMLPNRIMEQYKMASQMATSVIVGSQFVRTPEGSTLRYTQWANYLSDEKLEVQIYTSHGPTVIMPTWFCRRRVFEEIGGFSENGKGTPEDLIFFYKHLDHGGKVMRVNQCLLVYTYHQNATTFTVAESTIWKLRLNRLENVVLPKWMKFTIWNAGKQGRKFYNSLSKQNQEKVVAFCDVAKDKIGKTYTPFDSKLRKSGKGIDIIHFNKATPPFIVCVKMNLTNGEFERNLATLKLTENIDYVMFS